MDKINPVSFILGGGSRLENLVTNLYVETEDAGTQTTDGAELQSLSSKRDCPPRPLDQCVEVLNSEVRRFFLNIFRLDTLSIIT